jgi:hypothetical protein
MNKLLCLLFISLIPFSTFAGPRVIGGGGDVYALQFVAIADKIVAHFQNAPVEGIQIEDLKAAVDTVVVESTDKILVLNKVPKDAINYPETKQIIFNRDRWNQIADEDKPALVLHEYLGILKIEDASYKYSKSILGDFNLYTGVNTGSDSAWYLCADDHLVVNFFEHRAGADTRATDITLIFGGYTFLGSLGDNISGPVVLKDPDHKGASFIGKADIDFRKDTFKIKGVLNLLGAVVQVDTTLNCKEKSGRR